MELNFPKLEQKILKFWKQNRTFEKSIKRRARARDFVFYEGPPTANAKAGLHHVLARVYKDIICRYKTMRGFRVLRKAGWDTHGLPVELEIEKKLGLKNKKEIEKYGIAKFNKRCKESVWLYKQDWEKLTERIGFWLNMKNPYITCEPDFIETLWWIIKQIWYKGLLYQDYKVVPYCPRCQTSLSSHEVALGYEKIKENSIYVKFKLKNTRARFFLVWTTTPWTLPANVALAVNSNLNYVEAHLDSNEIYILAEDRLEYLKKHFNIKNAQILRKINGKTLVNLEYEQLIDFAKTDKPAFRVVAGDFVSTKEGTGIVHIAPAFGEDDMEIAKKNNLPILMTVDETGRFKPEIKAWAGMYVKEADQLIIERLQSRRSLWVTELYEHDYPFCWRCASPLLYYAKQGWFINMQKVKKDLIKNNQKINWVPTHLKKGRFGEWLQDLKDWAFSRERYWGTPLPIWKCQKCQHLEVIGSKKELFGRKFSTNQYYVLRHGQTIYQTKKKKIMYPWPENRPILLTKEGEKQIKKVAKKLKNKKIDLIYASDVSRTRQTAEIVAEELGVKIIFDKRLRDINLGTYHGGRKEDFYRDFPKNPERFYGRKPPGGENWGECRKRMIDCLNDIDRRYQNKTILIVGHGDPLWLLEGVLDGLDDKKLLERKIKKTYVKTGEFRKIRFKKIPLDEKGKFDFHRPYIDQIKFYCSRCDGKMERVPEVVDCWFDSGAMPLAQFHYPFENKEKIDKRQQFPADYISEAVDQTRGWFYTLLAISSLLGLESPYKNVISLGHVLDEKGEKMSKSKGNVVNPWKIIEKYGSDSSRWYFYTINQPGDEKFFREKDIEDCLKRFILTLWNSYVFFETYVPKKEISRGARQNNSKDGGFGPRLQNSKSKNILDKWVVSKLNQLILEVTDCLNKYDITTASRLIEDFVIEDLSQWYIRRSRKRFQKPETKKELKEASKTFGFVFLILSKLTAPFIPFLSEEIHKGLTSGFRPSVHLEDWPKTARKLIDEKLEKKMEKVRELCALALAERAKVGIKVRQPLASLQIPNSKFQIPKELLGLIKEEVNVKEISFGKTLKLDTKITPELKEEGIVREVIRNIQEMRKKAGLRPKDKILVRYSGSINLNEILMRNKNLILKEAKVKNFVFGKKPKEAFIIEKEIKVDQEKLHLAIKKV